MAFKSGNAGSMDGIPPLAADRVVITSPTGVLTTSIVTSLELSYLSGATSNIQAQLNGKQPSGNYITDLTGDIVANGPGSVTATIQAGVIFDSMIAALAAISLSKLQSLTANRAVVSDGSGILSVSSVTATEVSYLSGVTSSIQAQLNATMTNPMTTGGDIIYGGASGTPTRLANGTVGQILMSQGSTNPPVWGNPSAPTIQIFTSGSGTWNRPTGCRMIEVEMLGGGGGGGGSGTGTSAGVGNPGGGSAFAIGTANQIDCNGGQGGGYYTSNIPGAGGGVIMASPWIGLAFRGTTGKQVGGINNTAGTFGTGGPGGDSPLGGSGSGGISTFATYQNATANTGSGGGGAGGGGTVNVVSATGGGAGGYIKATLQNPPASYAYSIGAGGNGGTAGTSGFAGGNGGSGILIVREYY